MFFLFFCYMLHFFVTPFSFWLVVRVGFIRVTFIEKGWKSLNKG